MNNTQDQITQFLVSDKVQNALKLAQSTSASDPESKETAITIAKGVAIAYRQYAIKPVQKFMLSASEHLSKTAASILTKGMAPLQQQSIDWKKTLLDVREERLARDLREFIRSKNLKSALQNINRLLTIAQEQKQPIGKRAEYIGTILGSVLSSDREGKKLSDFISEQPDRFGLTSEQSEKLEAARLRRRDSLMGASMDNLENQWKTVLKQAQVKLLNEMPPKNKLGDPDEDDMRNVGDMFRSVMRAPFLAGDQDLFIDATAILTDFCPKENSTVAKQSGIEGRSYNEIGFRAKKTCGLVFLEMGNSQILTNAYRGWAKEQLHTVYVESSVEMMGALRSNDFAELFLELWNDKEHVTLRPELLGALSNLTTPESAELLLSELKNLLNSSRTIDAKVFRIADRYLQALGRMVRSPRLDDTVRVKIVQTVQQTIPRTDSKLAMVAVKEVLAAKPDKLDATSLRWVIGTLVESIWIPVQQLSMEQNPNAQAGPLGPRASLVKQMIRIGKKNHELVVRSLQEKANQYSPALIAAAEILKEIPAEHSLSTLEKMTETVLHYDERQLSDYQKEKYYDSADQKFKPIAQDMILSSLVYAMGTIAPEDSKEALHSVLNAMKTVGVGVVGKETQEDLMNFLGTDAVLKSKKSSSISTAEQVSKTPSAPIISSTQTDELISTLKSKFLFSKSKRVSEKVSALAQLGQALPPAAIQAVVDNLDSKEPMIQSAAASTLAAYAHADQNQALKMDVVHQCLEGLSTNNELFKKGCKDALKAMKPNRRDLRDDIVKFGQSTSNGSVRLAIQEILGGMFLDSEPQIEVAVSDNPESVDSQPTMKTTSKMELKREYFASRKAWIDGGKQGPEPSRPDEI